MLFFFKASSAFIALGFFIFSYLKINRSPSKQKKYLKLLSIAGGCLTFIPFWCIKNYLTLQMPLFPFIIDSSLVPDIMSDGVKAWASNPSITVEERLNIAKGLLLNTSPLRHFKPSYFFLFLFLLSALFIKGEKIINWKYWSLLTALFLHWGYWLINYIFPHTTYRLIFPFFILLLPLIASRLKKCNIQVQNIYFLLFFTLSILSFSKEALVLPGIKWNLGLQSTSTYYTNLGQPFGAYLHSNPEILEVTNTAIISESAGVIAHPSLTYVNISKTLTTKQLNQDDFLSWASEKNISQVILDKPSNFPYIFNCLEEIVHSNHWEKIEQKGHIHRYREIK
jgi:hypothetical protein